MTEIFLLVETVADERTVILGAYSTAKRARANCAATMAKLTPSELYRDPAETTGREW